MGDTQTVLHYGSSPTVFKMASRVCATGGMKRRLSVAISFIGAPRVVYLDEPSTGLDPASRRNLWEVVKTSKQVRKGRRAFGNRG